MLIQPPRAAIAWAFTGLLFVLLWHVATLQANYGGNGTALFCTGALRGVPPSLAAEHIYQFPRSVGYDGQIYHYMAHDPWMADPDIQRYVDEPRLRYRRILFPVLAWAAALGRSTWIDRGYYAVFLLFTGLGIFWSSRTCASLGLPSACGLLFILMPATLVGIDRMVIDLALAALSVAFVLYAPQSGWRLWAVLVAAPLTRETGFILIAASCLSVLAHRRWRQAAVTATAAIPALAWYGWVQLHTAPYHYEASLVPLSGMVHTLFYPEAYPPGIPFLSVLQAADTVGLAALLAAFLLALWNLRVCPREAVRLAAALFALMGILVQRADFWTHAFNYGRLYTPLLIFLAFDTAKRRGWLGLGLLAWAGVSLRVGMQFAPQILGIIERRSRSGVAL